VVIATKIFGGMDGRTPNHCRLSRGNILDSVYACLARMQLDHIDLLYWHAAEDRTPLEEGLCAVEDLVQRDLVRYFGVGNLSVGRLRLHRALESSMSIRCRVVAVQNGFDIIHGETNPEHRGVLDYCAANGISYIAYSPLARGLLTERYLDLANVGPGDRLYDEGTLERDALPAVMVKVRSLAALAHRWGMQLQQLALAYTLTLPGMGPVIPGTSSLAQLESNAAVGQMLLSDEQQRQVQAVLAGQSGEDV